MKDEGIEMQINWESFATYNHDIRGIRFKFEDLCRQLFANENLSGNKQFRYLHANPNNHGLETEPIYDETNKRWIGFQAKFFDQDVQLVTDTAVLDLIRNKYPYLGLYYFGNHTIQQEWFTTHTSYMLDELGERYNRDFNVGTVFSDELSLFIHDRRAAEYLNAKKTVLLDEISELLYRSSKRDYLRKLEEVVSALPDVNIETLYHSIEWNSTCLLYTSDAADD